MVDYRASNDPIRSDKLKSGAGRLFGIVAVFVALLAGLLFVSGFWNPRPTQAALPPVEASAGPSAMAAQRESAAPAPKDSLAGTMKLPVDLTPVDLPKARKPRD